VALVAPAPWERSVPAVGELLPWERVVVATKVAGRLESLGVDRGDAVRAGQELATLEPLEFRMRERAAEAAVGAARALLGLPIEGLEDEVDPGQSSIVREARAALDRARLERERAAALAREGVDSQSVSDRAEADFLEAESRLQEAFELVAARRATLAQRRAELEIARAQLAETRLEAPFDARVVRRLAAPGAYLAPGDAVCELVRVDPLRLRLEVSERDAGAVRAGQGLVARVEGLQTELSGRVARVAPALTESARTLVIEADVPAGDGRLRPGAFAEGRVIVAPEEPAPTIPRAAVTTFAGIDKVLVVVDGRTEERRPRFGRRDAERLEVLSGLEPGESVVLAPEKLGIGVPVQVVP